MKTKLETATKYLESKNIAYYDKHIQYIAKYREYLYLLNAEDREEKYFSYSKTTAENNTTQLKTQAETRKRINTNIHINIIKEFASVLFNEQIDFKLSNNRENIADKKVTLAIDILRDHYTKNQVWQLLENSMIEVLGAGVLAILTTIDNVYGIQHISYNGDCILPLKIVGSKIVECAFIGTDILDDTITRLTICRQQREERIETTGLLNKANIKKTVLTGYETEVITIKTNEETKKEDIESIKYTSNIRPFIILKPFNRNSIDYSNAFGLPIYWDYIDLVREVDNIYNQIKLDRQRSIKQVFMSEDLVTDPYNNSLNIPSEYKDAGIFIVNSKQRNSNEGEAFIKEYAPTTNTSDYLQNLKETIKQLSSSVGLGTTTLSLDKTTAPTATQIISENTEKFTNSLKHYSQMRDEFVILNSRILELLLYGDDIKIQYNTEDNIVEDTNTITQRAISEYNAGLMSVKRYLVDIKGLAGEELNQELSMLGFDKDGLKSRAEFNAVQDNIDKITTEDKKENINNNES